VLKILWKTYKSLPMHSFFDELELKDKERFVNFIKAFHPLALLQDIRFRKLLSGIKDKAYFDVNEDIAFQSISLPAELVEASILNTQKYLNNKQKNDKSYFRELTNLRDYEVNSPELQLATDPKLIKSVANYLNCSPVLLNITAVHSPKSLVKGSEVFSGSQLFHRDADDTRILKVWIFCSDVTNHTGPTVLINAKQSEEIARSINYKQGSRANDKSVTEEFSPELNFAIGPRGSQYATDTARLLHYGSRTGASADRLVLMFHYVSPYSQYTRLRLVNLLFIIKRKLHRRSLGVLNSYQSMLLR
jgi:hypothetical protein